MVIEGIVTTENPDGSAHIAPIGPHVDQNLAKWVLMPFQSSTTFANLQSRDRCVFHVVDDALLMAAAVLGHCNSATPHSDPALAHAIGEVSRCRFETSMGWILENSCRTFALSVVHWDLSEIRAIAECQLIQQKERRPFWGWNRAASSILELSIVASRVHLMDRAQIEAELARHRIIVQKTAGPREFAAWELLNTRLSQ